MAGRGCIIQIEINQGGANRNVISLPVALHSPLQVLKEQLETLTNIPQDRQVVILCDLSDSERNSDVLLAGQDNLSLFDCGIREGSYLALHALGISAQNRIQVSFRQAPVRFDEEEIHFLRTRVAPENADHSYNGVIFDIQNLGPFEVELLSFSLAGMLGRVRIFARDRPWEADLVDNPENPHWWAQRESVSTAGWEVLADLNCLPSWDRPIEVMLSRPFRLLPHTVHGIYCHSNLPDDLGIQYQSYRKNDVVAEDPHIRLLPGVGHTGSEPFDDNSGWYRRWRGLAGGVRYTVRWKGWTIAEHKMFPVELRQSVKCVLMCHNRLTGLTSGRVSTNTSDSKCSRTEGYMRSAIARLPKDVVVNILEFMHWDWFENIRPNPTRGMLENDALSESGAGDTRRGLLHRLMTHFRRFVGHGAEEDIENILENHGNVEWAQDLLGNGMEEEDSHSEYEDVEDDADSSYGEVEMESDEYGDQRHMNR